MSSRPFRFGVQADGAAITGAAVWRNLARQVEAAGYDVLTMPDHFTDQLAPVPALMAAADATERLRIGALVWDNDYKNPVVLAKELATMDVLSEGRVEIGIGAGWLRTDYDAVGMTYDSNGVRVDRFEEALHVLKGTFSPGPFSFTGNHYTITDYNALPKPLQQPWPPILVGGGGKRVLSIAARHADIIGVSATMMNGAIDASALASMTAEAVDAKVALVNEVGAGREFELNMRAFMVNVTDDRAAAAKQIGGAVGFSAEQILESPFALVGNPRELIADLLERRERWGFSYIIVGASDIDAFAPVVADLSGR